MAFGIETYAQGVPIITDAVPMNLIHSIRISNQNGGTYVYPILNNTEPGELLYTTGRICTPDADVNQGGNSKYQIASATISGSNFTVTMVAIPDPNIVSKPLYFNFFKRRA